PLDRAVRSDRFNRLGGRSIQQAHRGELPLGRVVLQSCWKHDYPQLIADRLAARHAADTGAHSMDQPRRHQMENPLRRREVSTEAVGDGLSVFDPEQKQSYVLNATSALVFQHCDGQTTPQQLTELLCRTLNVPPAEAEQLTRLALDELETNGLLQSPLAFMLPPAATYSRREALTSFAALGLSLTLMPMI